MEFYEMIKIQVLLFNLDKEKEFFGPGWNYYFNDLINN